MNESAEEYQLERQKNTNMETMTSWICTTGNIFGPLADIAREKLLRDYPDKFECAISMMNGSQSEPSVEKFKIETIRIFPLSAIKKIIEREACTKSFTDRPAFLYIKFPRKKSIEQAIKLEKLWHHVLPLQLH
ncbi:Tight junction protein ZO-2 [Dermatophagoides pteronyssinus]|uniref:Tight junction protein ZO-2 n=1 Tax=Dermatophagoides pteronyssinus TaxID=6956 RepID=A0ABQ8J3F7_DERPT|nr:Tight junction protein ZO-2 [Dermatophagoides pteronyssinus]